MTVIDTARGPVEYDQSGTGVPVVVLHGSPGGIDAAALMARILPADRVTSIVLSRPGYLGTPLDSGRTPDEQADLVIALLDTLGIDRAGVFTWSGSGPMGYRLAVRHPERIRALVAFAALSKPFVEPRPGLADRLMFDTGAGRRMVRTLVKYRPGDIVAGALSSESSLRGDELKAAVAAVMSDPAARSFVLDMTPTAFRDRTRRRGYDNDLAQFEAFGSLELAQVTTPTLVVQGTADTDVTPDHSEHAVEEIPGAELLNIAGGSHFALFAHPDAAAAQRRVVDFLTADMPG
ncbi:alpha/beta fold hydrolase [Jongsikchunia kroppenstedtii]|uniref:alpha/beta fold hydrolase n=1 Tax=Jongsikchunia kroppenstedtii TaxID=1121721 RepID=UPI0003AB29CB|nr:alpha/beta hydrolase [Jongsikchunia kroppenstedtii]